MILLYIYHIISIMEKDMSKIIEVNGKIEVKKADAIVQARYKLNPLAIKFITVLITGIKRSDPINEEYVFKVSHFKELTGLKRKDLYKAIDDAIVELLDSPLKIPLNDEKNSILRVNWVSSAIYNDGEVRFKISDELRPYLLEAKEKFLKYRLENILPLRSAYSIRMYELLKDWYELKNRYGHKTEKVVSIDELRKMLEIPKSYLYNNIKVQVIKKSQADLSKHTDISFEFKEIKSNRKVTHIKFFISCKFDEKDYKKEQALKSLNNFIQFLRDNYAGTGKKILKSFKNDGFYGISDKGILYLDTQYEDIDPADAMTIYRYIYILALESTLYSNFLFELEDFEKLEKEDPILFKEVQAEIKEIIQQKKQT